MNNQKGFKMSQRGIFVLFCFTVSFIVSFVAYEPKLSNALTWRREAYSGMKSIELVNYDDEKFLDKDKNGFLLLEKVICDKIGCDIPSKDFFVRGISHTKSIVFLCTQTPEGDSYRMVAPMSEVKKWVSEEFWKRLF